MKFSRTFVLILVLILLAIPAAAQTSAAIRAMSCSEILEGQRYAFVFQGFYDLGDGMGLTPNVGGGVIHFGHDGRFSALANLNIGGFPVMDYSLEGPYSMKENTSTQPPVCAGTAAADSGPTFQFIVTRNGEILEQMHTDQGLIAVVTSLPVERGPCTNASLRGSYVYSANGFFATSGPMQPFGAYTPFGFSGVVSFDGRGHLNGWDTVSIGGQVLPEPRTYSGTYHMRPDCTATSEFQDSLHNDVHTVNYLYKDGKAVAIVNVDAGTVLAFNATRE